MSTTVYTNNGQVLIDVSDNKWLAESSGPGPTPIVLPDNTIRIRFRSGYTPTMGTSQTLVDSTNNVWDIYNSSNSWDSWFLAENSAIIEVLASNTRNVTTMDSLFYNCSDLINVPLLDVSSCTNMTFAFYGCRSVESGALALYQRASSNPSITSYSWCFRNCGSDTTTGAAELAQIPSGWK